jgi:Uma2 family endonuclease
MTAPAPTTSPLVRRYTIDEFFALDEPGDGSHYELIAGVLYVVPPPTGPHHTTAVRLNKLFVRLAGPEPGRWEVFFPRSAIWTSADTYLEPDLFLLSRERVATVDVGRLTTADLVVEIVSSSSAIYDRNTKADTYAALGVRELWLVDPERRTVEVRVLEGDRWGARRTSAEDAAVESTVFPGLVVSARDVFAAL